MSLFPVKSHEEKRVLELTYVFEFQRLIAEINPLNEWMEQNFEEKQYKIDWWISGKTVDITVKFTELENAAKFKLFWSE